MEVTQHGLRCRCWHCDTDDGQDRHIRHAEALAAEARSPEHSARMEAAWQQRDKAERFERLGFHYSYGGFEKCTNPECGAKMWNPCGYCGSPVVTVTYTPPPFWRAGRA